MFVFVVWQDFTASLLSRNLYNSLIDLSIICIQFHFVSIVGLFPTNADESSIHNSTNEELKLRKCIGDVSLKSMTKRTGSLFLIILKFVNSSEVKLQMTDAT